MYSERQRSLQSEKIKCRQWITGRLHSEKQGNSQAKKPNKDNDPQEEYRDKQGNSPEDITKCRQSISTKWLLVVYLYSPTNEDLKCNSRNVEYAI